MGQQNKGARKSTDTLVSGAARRSVSAGGKTAGKVKATSSEPTSGRPRGRLPGSPPKGLAQPSTATVATTSAPKRRPGRPSLKASEADTSTAPAATAVEPTKKRRPGQPRKSDASTATATPASTAKRKRGQPPIKAGVSTPGTAPASGLAPAKTKSTKAASKRRRTSGPDTAEKRRRGAARDHGAVYDDGSDGASDNDDDEKSSDVPDMHASYLQLVPRTHMVSTATMKRRWAPLEQDAVAAVQTLLVDCARPVLARFSANGGSETAASERRQEQARQAILGVTRRLRSKLVKGLPFPPSTVADGPSRASKKNTSGGSGSSRMSNSAMDFHFERTMEGLKALERQLTPLQHAATLLERARAREAQALDKDYATLRQLERNALAESRTWRERARQSHALTVVDDVEDSADDDNPELPLELVKKPVSDAETDDECGIFENLDEDLMAVVMQLGSHMDSLQGNLQQIEGVVPAMTRSKAALQQALHTRLAPEQYEQIVLGE